MSFSFQVRVVMGHFMLVRNLMAADWVEHLHLDLEYGLHHICILHVFICF